MYVLTAEAYFSATQLLYDVKLDKDRTLNFIETSTGFTDKFRELSACAHNAELYDEIDERAIMSGQFVIISNEVLQILYKYWNK